MMSTHNIRVLDHTGIPPLEDASVALVHTEWNADVVGLLERGCREQLLRHGLSKVSSHQVPGSFELPFACRRLYEQTRHTPGQLDALVAIGCVIRGGTPHFEYVCRAVTDGILELNMQLPIPVIFAVLTVDTLQQAMERAGGPQGHKGEEAAITALKMIAYNRSLRQINPI